MKRILFIFSVIFFANYVHAGWQTGLPEASGYRYYPRANRYGGGWQASHSRASRYRYYPMRHRSYRPFDYGNEFYYFNPYDFDYYYDRPRSRFQSGLRGDPNVFFDKADERYYSQHGIPYSGHHGYRYGNFGVDTGNVPFNRSFMYGDFGLGNDNVPLLEEEQ